MEGVFNIQVSENRWLMAVFWESHQWDIPAVCNIRVADSRYFFSHKFLFIDTKLPSFYKEWGRKSKEHGAEHVCTTAVAGARVSSWHLMACCLHIQIQLPVDPLSHGWEENWHGTAWQVSPGGGPDTAAVQVHVFLKTPFLKHGADLPQNTEILSATLSDRLQSVPSISS